MKNIFFLLFLYQITADISIYSPDQLRTDFETLYGVDQPIPSSLANFGNPPYGSIMIGKVYYGEQQSQSDACGNFKNIDFSSDRDALNSHILLVDRGGCTFSQKVRHAQNIGARAVIIVDDKDEDVINVIMADDGSAGNIFIPSFLIKKSDGQKIKNYLKGTKPQEVQILLEFTINNPDNRVEYELYTTSGSHLMSQFMYNFSYLANQFNNDEMLFTPHYVFWFCIECKNAGFTYADPDCLSGGKYCAPDPDNVGPRTGRDIVEEDLRSLCIYQQTSEQKNKKL